MAKLLREYLDAHESPTNVSGQKFFHEILAWQIRKRPIRLISSIENRSSFGTRE